MSIKKKASAHWAGDLKTGIGSISTETGVLNKAPYGFKARFEGGKGTNPEELIGAAHAGCFTMALAFQLQTLDGKVARHFIVKDQRITSRSGVHPAPAFAIAFKDAAYGFATMQAKNKQLAFMTGIQDKSIQIKGNPALVIWFQGLTKYLKPRKKAKA